MKKQTLLLVALLACFGMNLSVFANHSLNAEGDKSQQIVFDKTTDNKTPPLQAPGIMPVIGWYDSQEDIVELTFLQDLGAVTVTINGIAYSTQGDASTTEYINVGMLFDGVYEIVISSSRGTYVGYIYIL